MRRTPPKKRRAEEYPSGQPSPLPDWDDFLAAQPACEELDRFFDLTLDLLCIAGFDGYFKRLNPAWERTLGCSQEQLLAAPYLDFVHPDDRESTRAAAERLATGAPVITFENRYRCRDGSYKWLLWNAAPVREHQLIYAAARDITDRKEAEQALRESEERTRLILDRAHDPFVAIDSSGLITDWNEQAERVFGWSRREAFGRPLVETLIPARYREAHLRGLARFLDTGEGPILNKRIELPALHRDGHEIPVELSVTALRWRENCTFYAFLYDISERRALERMKDEFISMVSHELRTPLSALRGALGVLGGGELGALSEKGQRMLQIALDETDRLVRLTNDILDIERLKSGRFTLVKRDCDAGRLVTQALESMRPLAEKARVSLAASPQPIPLRADPDRLLQALANLISNAIKFSPAGAPVWVGAASQGEEVLFQVKDQGPGISTEDRENLFERFRQLGPASREKGGAGLGLFITHGIVRRHGGRIWADSAPGQGSTFSFTIPAAGGRGHEKDPGC